MGWINGMDYFPLDGKRARRKMKERTVRECVPAFVSSSSMLSKFLLFCGPEGWSSVSAGSPCRSVPSQVRLNHTPLAGGGQVTTCGQIFVDNTPILWHYADMKKIIALSDWAKKNKVSHRTARRLVQQGVIPTKPFPLYIAGVEADFKLPKK